jgi:hypothetical protein
MPEHGLKTSAPDARATFGLFSVRTKFLPVAIDETWYYHYALETATIKRVAAELLAPPQKMYTFYVCIIVRIILSKFQYYSVQISVSACINFRITLYRLQYQPYKLSRHLYRLHYQPV